MKLVKLIDGTEVDSASMAWALECLARHVLAIKPLAARRAWLDDFGKNNKVGLEQLQDCMAKIHAAKRA